MSSTGRSSGLKPANEWNGWVEIIVVFAAVFVAKAMESKSESKPKPKLDACSLSLSLWFCSSALTNSTTAASHFSRFHFPWLNFRPDEERNAKQRLLPGARRFGYLLPHASYLLPIRVGQWWCSWKCCLQMNGWMDHRIEVRSGGKSIFGRAKFAAMKIGKADQSGKGAKPDLQAELSRA